MTPSRRIPLPCVYGPIWFDVPLPLEDPAPRCHPHFPRFKAGWCWHCYMVREADRRRANLCASEGCLGGWSCPAHGERTK